MRVNLLEDICEKFGSEMPWVCSVQPTVLNSALLQRPAGLRKVSVKLLQWEQQTQQQYPSADKQHISARWGF